jgi:hypothetical protein
MFVDFEGILKSEFSKELENVIDEKVESDDIIANEDNQEPVPFVKDIEAERQ